MDMAHDNLERVHNALTKMYADPCIIEILRDEGWDTIALISLLNVNRLDQIRLLPGQTCRLRLALQRIDNDQRHIPPPHGRKRMRQEEPGITVCKAQIPTPGRNQADEVADSQGSR